MRDSNIFSYHTSQGGPYGHNIFPTQNERLALLFVGRS